MQTETGTDNTSTREEKIQQTLFDPVIQRMYWYKNRKTGAIAVCIDIRINWLTQAKEAILLPYLSPIPILKNYEEFAKEIKKKKYEIINIQL